MYVEEAMIYKYNINTVNLCMHIHKNTTSS
jgi:hypothetical protein